MWFSGAVSLSVRYVQTGFLASPTFALRSPPGRRGEDGGGRARGWEGREEEREEGKVVGRLDRVGDAVRGLGEVSCAADRNEGRRDQDRSSVGGME